MSEKNTPLKASMASKTAHKTTESQGEFDAEALPEKIGKNLRQIYDDVLAEPVPDDFLNLLLKADNDSS